jgi:hypothetical protein
VPVRRSPQITPKSLTEGYDHFGVWPQLRKGGEELACGSYFWTASPVFALRTVKNPFATMVNYTPLLAERSIVPTALLLHYLAFRYNVLVWCYLFACIFDNLDS